MGRYRPPQPASSKYITPEGKQRLVEEVDKLWKKRRPDVTRALAAAAAEGDRSENAEYIYRKKELREIDARVRYLRKRLDGIVVVDRIPDDRHKVFFGAWSGSKTARARNTHIESSGLMKSSPHWAISAWTLPWAGPCWENRWMMNSPSICRRVRWNM